MLNISEAKELIKECIESLRRAGTISADIKINPETVILGRDSDFDSIGFITLITDIENRLEQRLGREAYVVLDEIEGFNVNNPSLTVDSLADYIKNL
ncbi:hypothetical protein [Polynucleobacter bastaniensis]|uniref:hypothetical protein n=1 Tax=Polynucleobacter bastaniensis TaxID=2081039 RepID=UPI001C0E51F9|nr:hypothetical protein [Polynucleobacter bastaniensis]MBU3597332.1 hypothetical protein [Polynucleobacter bastaniensis]